MRKWTPSLVEKIVPHSCTDFAQSRSSEVEDPREFFSFLFLRFLTFF